MITDALNERNTNESPSNKSKIHGAFINDHQTLHKTTNTYVMIFLNSCGQFTDEKSMFYYIFKCCEKTPLTHIRFEQDHHQRQLNSRYIYIILSYTNCSVISYTLKSSIKITIWNLESFCSCSKFYSSLHHRISVVILPLPTCSLCSFVCIGSHC